MKGKKNKQPNEQQTTTAGIKSEVFTNIYNGILKHSIASYMIKAQMPLISEATVNVQHFYKTDPNLLNKLSGRVHN